MFMFHFHLFFFPQARDSVASSLVFVFPKSFSRSFHFRMTPDSIHLRFRYAHYEVTKVTHPSCVLKPSGFMSAVQQSLRLHNSKSSFRHFPPPEGRNPGHLCTFGAENCLQVVLAEIQSSSHLSWSLLHHGHQCFWLLKPDAMAPVQGGQRRCSQNGGDNENSPNLLLYLLFIVPVTNKSCNTTGFHYPVEVAFTSSPGKE